MEVEFPVNKPKDFLIINLQTLTKFPGENVTPALSTMRARSTAERKARGGGTAAAADYGDGPDATAAASVQR